MNRYQLLKNNTNIIFQFIKNGILSYQVNRDIEIYETYLAMNDDNVTKEVKHLILADTFELSPKRIEQIIYNMEKVII